MFGIGGFNPLNMVSQIALGIATGGMSLVMQMAMNLVSQVIQQVIAQVGRQLGLPEGVINGAQQAFQQASGFPGGANAFDGLATAGGFTPTQMGQLDGMLTARANDIVSQLVRMNAQEGTDEDGRPRNAAARAAAGGGSASGAAAPGGSGAASNTGGGSWLHMIAEVLGEKLNQLAEDMKAGADALDWNDPKKATQFQADIQAFNLVFNTVSTAMKTFGEAIATAARKQ